MATRSMLLVAFSLLLTACGTTAQAQIVAVATPPTADGTDAPALAAAEKGRLGKPALVYFRATWCNVCRRAEPVVRELVAAREGAVAVIRMDIDDRASRPAVDRYRISATPTFVLLSADGNILATIPGWPGRATMEMAIEQMSKHDR